MEMTTQSPVRQDNSTDHHTAKSIAKILLDAKAVTLSIDPPYTWTSGIKSPIYCDNRLLISYPDKREFILNKFKEIITKNNITFDVIAGTATAAIPWASFIAQSLGKPVVYVRPKPKGHGAGKQVEGTMRQGSRVLIIEDLISTGGSSIRSAQACKREYNANIVGVMAIFTYELEKAKNAFREANIKLHTLSNFSTLVHVATEHNILKKSEKTEVQNWSKNPEKWSPTKQYSIGIYGSAVKQSEVAIKKAETLGIELGKRKSNIITGACEGMPYFVAKKAKDNGAKITGYSPAENIEGQREMYKNHNPEIYDKLVYTPKMELNIARKYRNVMSTANCDAAFIVAGRWGTLNEFTNLMDMGKIIGVLNGTGGIADELPALCSKINKKTNAQIVFGDNPEKLVDKVYTLLEKRHNPKPIDGKLMTYSERVNHTENLTAKKLFTLMDQKQTNLAVSVDLTKKEQILDLLEKIGPEICLVKTHIDIIDNFDQYFLTQLQQVAVKHNFMIFEDRKFADIGNTVKHQYQDGTFHIVDWADIVNAHTVPGPGIIEGLKEVGQKRNRGLLLLAEMSSKGNLATGNYTKQTIDIAKEHKDFVIGFISMGQIDKNPGFINMTPGVKLSGGGDNLKQQYKTPQYVVKEKGSDVIIVGRGIYQAPNPLEAAKQYRQAGWQAYKERIQ